VICSYPKPLRREVAGLDVLDEHSAFRREAFDDTAAFEAADVQRDGLLAGFDTVMHFFGIVCICHAYQWAGRLPAMKIAKPMLLVTTPLGVGFGIYEGFRLAGGLVFLMIALISLVGVAMATVVATVRRERKEEQAARESSATAREVSK
jgi:hypothetical protein